MGEIVRFEIGCRGCSHLIQIGKKTFLCEQKVHMDDSEVIPIRDGKRTDDWNICNGDSYTRVLKHSS